MALVSIRMDDVLKKEFDKVCNDLGLSMSTAVIILAKKMTRERRIPFDVSVDSFYSPQNMAALAESLRQIENGQTVEKNLDELDSIADA